MRKPEELRFRAQAAYRLRKVVKIARTLWHACKLLTTIWSALPWYVQWIVGLAIAVKTVTGPFPDGGVDEVLLLVAGVLMWRQRMLLKALYHEAGQPYVPYK